MQMLMSWYTSKQDVPNSCYYNIMSLVDLLFPKICVGCGREGEYICLECQRKLVRPAGICPMCAKPSLDGWTHPRCRSKYGMERLLVGLPYRGLVQDCLKKVKYKSAWEVLDFLYRLQIPDIRLQENIVTAVPMFAKKARERGFDQAEMIAKLLAQDLRGSSSQVLERMRETRPMFGLKKKERRENVEGAFKLLNHYTIKTLNQRIILVDDVWTTGATMRECARMLKEAGAKEVCGVTLAR